MTIVRTLRSAMAAFWAACRSAIDLEDGTLVLGYILLGVGFWQMYQPLGYVVPGALIVLPRIVGALLQRQRAPTRGRQRWAS
jgi:hypothetical protein